MKKLVYVVIIAVIVLYLFNRLTQANHKPNKASSKNIAVAPSPTPCPQVNIPISTEITPIKEHFDPYTPPIGAQFDHELNNIDAYPWTADTPFDVTGDGVKEQILYANISMNHTPHLIRILKDGYVVFKAEAANISASEVPDHNGFLLHVTVDWNPDLITKTTRYVYKDGTFVPTFYSENCNQ
jgi:hypothetical protein